MDSRLRGFLDPTNGIQLGNQSFSVLSNQNLVAGPRFENAFLDHNFRESHYLQPDQTPSHIALSSSEAHGNDYPEDCDFSDTVLGYISQILMEEDMEDKTCMLQDSLELEAAEKSFYDLLGKKYPPSPVHSTNYIDGNGESPDDIHHVSSSFFGDNNLIQNQRDYSYTPQLQSLPLYSISQSSYGSSNSVISSVDGLVDSPSSSLQVPDLNSENQSVWQFRKGAEEATMFLPRGSELFFNLEANGLFYREPKTGNSELAVKMEKKEEGEYSTNGSRGKRHCYEEDGDKDDERRSKQAAVYIESTLRSEMFDKVLLINNAEGRDHVSNLREALPNETSRTVLKNGVGKTVSQNGKSKGSNGGRGRGKKQSGNKEVVDLRTLLIQCAQAVAADDQRSANELLKQIRQHSSLFGDGNQRLAYCFADGLEARMAGTGSQIYKGLVSKRRSAADILRAYHLYLAACPFRKMSNFASNRMIMSAAAKATRIHVIDFGIRYGFQWPTFIQKLSLRPGGPPKLRITGIECPQPGFRPAERVEETGRRLANYAESFHVPFEYYPIAKKWETIQVEELKIEKDEFLVVNCLYRGKNLHDESVSVRSSRDIVLNLIRKINPDIFIHGIVNGSFNAPFFVTRFREALFHYSALFDMLETLVPREDRERMVIEKEIFGREALNVIACEGWERMERPETYKQWQFRNLRAGFAQLPMDRDIVKKAVDKVRSSYHKDFVIDEDSRWLLQGWKGRIIYALSCWKPA
ncbi:scarecrow-like protein 9 [Alnus glutinosa]|uniref:scarecrow-like protein 9 n=1 Tax=Alnus glutinosa TaxID=3517 RepID=UPI002D771910|nr:scarecrow-like protein 9 [Alnus glutinosa]XP_062167956.1 scarecrow-like protein 9 [Alnus glutinosa]XP_062167958.1 scarecrow-like protein 9 [Alnus glutinosa]